MLLEWLTTLIECNYNYQDSSVCATKRKNEIVHTMKSLSLKILT